jgi:ferric-chelate reductase
MHQAWQAGWGADTQNRVRLVRAIIWSVFLTFCSVTLFIDDYMHTISASIEWFAPMLMDIATLAADTSLDLHISVFVTCLCDPEAVPSIPNLDVTIVRPFVHTLLNDLLKPLSTASASNPSVDVEGTANENPGGQKPNSVPGGGVAICASGPETLMREAQNAVARLGLRRGSEFDKIALHTELFVL